MPQVSPNPVLSEKWLMRAAWWVAHKNQIRNIVAGLVLSLSVIALVYDGYAYLDYWVLSRDHDQRMFNELSAHLVNFSVIQKPQPIGISNVIVLSQSRSDEHFD